MNSHHSDGRNGGRWHGGIYEEIPFGVWLCGADGGLRYASESFLELLGMTMEEASGFGWTERIASQDEDSVERWKRSVEEERDWDDEHRIEDQQGRMRTLIARGHPVRDDSGDIEHWIGVHLDITERKKAEQRVEDERNFARAIVETTPEPLIVLDEEHRVVTANPAFYRTFEARPEDTENVRLHELGNGQWDIPALHHLLEEVLQRDGRFEGYEIEHDFPSIGRKAMLVSSRRIRRRVSDTEMVLLAISDVTEARKKEDRLRIVRETQAVQQERERLAQRLHDDLQQYLTGALIHVDTVERRVQEDENRRSLQVVQNILKDAIDASRHLAVELTPPVLMESPFFGALEWLADWMKQTYHLDLRLQVEPQVELKDEAICHLLFDTMRELLLNIVKHAHVNTATLEARRVDDQFEIVVRDEGVGARPDQIEKKEGNVAAGFGVSNIRRRIEAVGGTFEIDSVPQKGTTVTVHVPVRQE